MLLASSNYDKDEMEQRQQRKIKHKVNNMQKSQQSQISQSKIQRHTASVDTLDYELSSSDDDNDRLEKVAVARDSATIRRENQYTDQSDGKTSDITKVSQVRDVSGIVHERKVSSQSEHTRILDTRSDMTVSARSQKPNLNEDRNLFMQLQQQLPNQNSTFAVEPQVDSAKYYSQVELSRNDQPQFNAIEPKP